MKVMSTFKKSIPKIRISITGPQRICVAASKILFINQINVTLLSAKSSGH